ncbi:hypothetical protein QQ73_02400 [Candidatus Endoriftia persephone str. Guaymas]|nr:hypothetical protein [Candidatus Endoriftia persephone str. Guaymas]
MIGDLANRAGEQPIGQLAKVHIALIILDLYLQTLADRLQPISLVETLLLSGDICIEPLNIELGQLDLAA